MNWEYSPTHSYNDTFRRILYQLPLFGLIERSRFPRNIDIPWNIAEYSGILWNIAEYCGISELVGCPKTWVNTLTPTFHGIFLGYSNTGMAYRFTDISVKPIYRLFQKYRLSVSVKAWTNKISVIGYRLWLNIGYRLSAKTNRFAIPANNYHKEQKQCKYHCWCIANSQLILVSSISGTVTQVS